MDGPAGIGWRDSYLVEYSENVGIRPGFLPLSVRSIPHNLSMHIVEALMIVQQKHESANQCGRDSLPLANMELAVMPVEDDNMAHLLGINPVKSAEL